MPRCRNLNQWRGQYWFRRTVKGRVIRIPLGTDHTEAKRLYRIYSQQFDRHTYIPPELREAAPKTVTEAYEAWLTQKATARRKERNVYGARKLAERYVLPEIGKKTISTLTPGDLWGFRMKLAEQKTKDGKKISTNTLRAILSDASCVFRFVTKTLRWIETSPYEPEMGVRIKRRRTPMRKSDEELSAILSATPRRYLPLLALGGIEGLRWSEAKGVRWKDVQLGHETPFVRLPDTKSGEYRDVPLFPDVVEILKLELEAMGNVKPHPESYVCLARPLCSTRTTRAIGKRAGVKFTFHQLRHTAACRYIEAGGSIEILKEILGHSTVVTTEIYAKLSRRAVFAESKRLNLGIHVTKAVTGKAAVAGKS